MAKRENIKEPHERLAHAVEVVGKKHRFKKGHKKLGGRKMGTPNKTTRIIREAAIIAAGNVGKDGKGKDGLVGYFEDCAVKERKQFMQLLEKILPLQIAGKVGISDGQEQYRTADELKDRLKEKGLPVPSLMVGPATATNTVN